MAKTTIIPAREAKNRFGEMLDIAQRQPVTITKNGRPVARLVAIDQKRFEEIEDQIWLERAEKAMKKGDFLTHEESMRVLARYSNARAENRSTKRRRQSARKVASKARSSSI